jgi:DNA polymerase delta subunit 3
MKDVFDEDEDSGEDFLAGSTIAATTKGPSRKEREARLRTMMDMEDEENDEPMADGDISEAKDEPEETEAPAEDVVDNSAALDKPTVPNLKKETSTVSNGRRRGHRRIMKKITTKDADGYLVTTEEPSWESFSEDEPEPPKKKAFIAPTNFKKKGGAGDKTQGSITNFFGKKT